MFTIIGGDGQEYGPVSLQQLRAWVAEGRANLDTQVKTVGSTDWRRLGELPEFNAARAATEPPPLRQPSPTVAEGPVDPATFANDLIARAGKLDVFSCLDRSFQLWKAHLLSLVGITLLLLVTQMVLNLMLGMIPVIGSIAGALLNGVFYGGLYYYYLGKMRGEPREVGDAFIGFKRGLGALIGATALTTVITVGAMLLCFGPIFWPILKAAMAGNLASVELPTVSAVGAIAITVGILIVFYLSISWLFTFALIVDQGLGAWSAMEVSRRVVTKQWFRVFLLALLGGIIAALGLIGFIVGILFTMPIAIGAIMYAYEDLCNPSGVTTAPAM
jgi:GYF domain 2